MNPLSNQYSVNLLQPYSFNLGPVTHAGKRNHFNSVKSYYWTWMAKSKQDSFHLISLSSGTTIPEQIIGGICFVDFTCKWMWTKLELELEVMVWKFVWSEVFQVLNFHLHIFHITKKEKVNKKKVVIWLNQKRDYSKSKLKMSIWKLSLNLYTNLTWT